MSWTNLIWILLLGIQSSNAKCRFYEDKKMAECTSLDEEQLMAFIKESDYRLRQLKVENSFIPRIEILPICESNNLGSLIMRNSRIESISELTQVLRGTKHLKLLDLSFNSLKEMSFLAGSWGKREISLHHNQIEFLDASALEFSNDRLEYLDLSYNNIKNYTTLRIHTLNTLNLSHNSIGEIKGLVNGSVNIELLDLSHNKLSKVSVDDFGDLKRIHFLNLSHNEIHTIQYDPSESHKARFLFWRDYLRNGVQTQLDLSHNKLKNISHILEDKSTYYHLKSINLEHNNLEDSSSFANLKSENIGSNIELGQNKIKKLHPFNFKGFTLKKLDVSFNEIESMPSTTFQKLNLDELLLNHNQITYLNDSIFDHFKLQRLNLSHNPITTINPLVFDKVTPGILDLSHCLLRGIPEGFSRNKWLSEIHLGHNNIETIKPNTFPSLGRLDLSNNKIKKLQPSIFSGITIQDYLNLSNNPLGTLEEVFDNATIGKVYLRGLSLSKLSKRDVRGLNMTYTLDLSHSGIEELDSHVFYGWSKLNNIILDDNNIKILPSNFFGFNNNLEELSMVRNPLSIIPQDSFPRKMVLETLHLTFNGNILKRRFFNMVFLRELHIVHSKIHELRKYSFKGLISLTKLNFENSTVLKIEPGAFLGLKNLLDFDAQNLFANISTLKSKVFVGLGKLLTLNLSRIGVVDIEDGAFYGLDNLMDLSLSHNKIGDLPKNSFVGLGSLKVLDLSNNNLTGKESTFPIGIFKDLVNLTHLYLQHNRIIKFHIGEFSNLRNLRFLNLSHNQLSYLDRHLLFPLRNLEVLDINSNHVIKFDYHFTLKHLSSLKTIGIGENKWPCENMTIMLNDFEEHGVDYRAISKLEFDVENMGGIYCVHVCNYLYCPTEEDLVVTY